jgi:hypothetical protein
METTKAIMRQTIRFKPHPWLFLYTVEQKSAWDNTRFYWITISWVLVLTPPFLFCAVIVSTLTPVGNGGVK